MAAKRKSRSRILLLNGPNLNLLGTREPETYGRATLPEIEKRLAALAKNADVDFEAFQSNHEGELIDRVQQARDRHDAILINPGGLTHSSVALRDAIAAVGVPTVELHLTNIQARETFRRRSLTAPVCAGTISGFGAATYDLAFAAALHLLSDRP
jgi:3-dehydroquinate dehydratase-2